jgi:hypothetical protein
METDSTTPLRRLPVDLSEIDLLRDMRPEDAHDYPFSGYLDLETGAVHQVLCEALSAVEDGEDRETLSPEAQEDWELAEQIIDGMMVRFLRIESAEPRGDFRLMEEFAERSTNPRLKAALFQALQRPKPFRRFKDELGNWPDARESWFAFKDHAHRDEIREWLRELGIDAIDSSPYTPKQPGQW